MESVDGGIGLNTLKAVETYVEENGLETAIENYQSLDNHTTRVYQHLIHLVEGGQEELTKQQHLQKNLYN